MLANPYHSSDGNRAPFFINDSNSQNEAATKQRELQEKIDAEKKRLEEQEAVKNTIAAQAAEIQRLTFEVGKLEEGKRLDDRKLEDMRSSCNNLEQQLRETRNTLNHASDVNSQLENDLRVSMDKELGWGSRPQSWRSNGVEIFFIHWGGDLIWDEAVGEILVTYAVDGTAFRPGQIDGLRDVWFGVRKSFAVVYRYRGIGELRMITARDDDGVRFDPM